MWTNSKISEFALEKTLSTAMSHLWLKCCCCLLQFVRNKKGRAGFQCRQIKRKVCQFSIYFEWNSSEVFFFWFCYAIQGNAYGVSLLCVSAKQCSCISLPLSFHSAHKLWMRGYKKSTMFFMLLLRECAPCKCSFTYTVLGWWKGLFFCTGVAGQPQPCLKIKQVRDRTTPHFRAVFCC